MAITLLPGCAMEEVPVRAPRPALTLRAVGYGTVRPDKGMTVNQMKLMSMRASRMDAYRNLTEQVYGIQIAGATTVGSMVVDNDSYKGYVSGYMHGAKLISQEPLTDNYTYETILELTVEDDFYQFANRLLAAYPPVGNNQSNSGGVAHSDRYYYNSH